jgi:RNA polymerase sigma-70 factor (ECF subfamily)
MGLQQFALENYAAAVVSRRRPAQHGAMTVQEVKPERTAGEWAELMLAVAERSDRDAFVCIFEYFAPRVKAYLRSLKADEKLAEDLAQDVLLTVWRRAGQFDPRQAALSTWIFTIARNRRIDAVRRERRPEIDPGDPALVPDPIAGPDRIYDATQVVTRVRAAIGDLPADQAELLRLSYLEEKSHSEIAEEKALPLGTVKSRLRLAMAKLKRQLEDMQ